MKVHNVEISAELLNKIVSLIKNKKEYQGVTDDLVISYLEKVFELEFGKFKRLVKDAKGKDIKYFVKQVRSKLRRVHGSFFVDVDRHKLLKEGKIDELLKSHKSTNERPKSFYNLLFDKVDDFKSVLDLGCGLNPIAFPKKVKYYACDINKEEISLVNEYFEIEGIDGEAWVCDLLKEKSFPKVDLCLMFKLVDLLDFSGHKNAEELIKKIDAKFIVVSFSTLTLSGKSMKHPYRGWIERMLDRLKYKWDRFELINEVFYVVRK